VRPTTLFCNRSLPPKKYYAAMGKGGTANPLRRNLITSAFNIHAQRTWNCITPLKGGQAVLHRRQA